MDLTLDQVKQFLEANKDDQAVKDYLKSFETEAELTDTAVMAYLETEAGVKLMQPRHDKYTNKAIETFKEKTLPGLVEAEVNKRYPPEDPKDKAFRELQEQFENEKIERQKEKRKSLAVSLAAEKGLRADVVEDLIAGIGETDEETRARIDRIATKDTEHINSKVNAEIAERLKGTTPGSGTPAPVGIAKLQEAQDQARKDAREGVMGARLEAIKIEDQKYAAGQKK